MSITLTAVPNPPSEYAFKTGYRMSLAEMREVVKAADAIGVPDDFRLVNSGHGNYRLRRGY